MERNPPKEKYEAEIESVASSSGDEGECRALPIVEMQPAASASAAGVGEDSTKNRDNERKEDGQQATCDLLSVSSAGGDDSSTAAIASTSGVKASSRRSDSVPSTSTQAFNMPDRVRELISRFEMLYAERFQTLLQHRKVVTELTEMVQRLNQKNKDFLSSLSSDKKKKTAKKNEERADFDQPTITPGVGVTAHAASNFPQADHTFSADAAGAANAQNEEEKPGGSIGFQNDPKDDGNDGDNGESIEEADADDDVNGKEGYSPHFEAKGRE